MRATFLTCAVRVSFCALALLIGSSEAGWSSPVDSEATGGDSGSSTFDNIEIVDASLVGKIGVTRVGSQPGENGLLAVFAGFKNRTGHELNLEVETVYKDAGGRSLNTASWIQMTLKPHEERSYRSSSITDQASDFLVRIRNTRK